MARRAAKRSTQIVRYAAPRETFAPRSGPIVVNVPRPVQASSRGGKKRRGGGKSRGGSDTIVHHVAAGALLGYLDKNGTSIPTVPMLGRAGTLALVCYFLKGKSPWFQAGAKTFGAIATYEMVRNGSISGNVASQVGDFWPGVADQT